MAESEISGYIETLQQVLIERKDWLEKEEMTNLKENLRTFHTSFLSLYNVFLKKKLIDEDPYKQETKITELEIPDSSLINEIKRREQLSIRLSNFDNQLDFLVNFYQLNMDFLNIDRVKRIVGLIRYIDWTSLTVDSPALMTQSIAELSKNAKVGLDQLTHSIIGESLTRLNKITATIMNILKGLNSYFRESYKLAVRQKITQDMSAAEATLDNIRKKIPVVMPGSPFYKELIEEIIREDYSKSGLDLRDSVLNTLKVPAQKQKAVKAAVNYKLILLEGIQIIGGASASFHEISIKLDENQAVMDNRKKGFLETLKELLRQITNTGPEETLYTLEYLDQTKGTTVREELNFHQFRDDIEKKTKILNSFMRGPAYNKLAAMEDDQILGYLERNIRDVQSYHKTLSALDEFFKARATPEDREKIKGIKPELAALKNTIIKANQRRYEYITQKEEEEQLKRLGLNIPPSAQRANQ